MLIKKKKKKIIFYTFFPSLLSPYLLGYSSSRTSLGREEHDRQLPRHGRDTLIHRKADGEDEARPCPRQQPDPL
jgi:hypothetical protein